MKTFKQFFITEAQHSQIGKIAFEPGDKYFYHHGTGNFIKNEDGVQLAVKNNPEKFGVKGKIPVYNREFKSSISHVFFDDQNPKIDIRHDGIGVLGDRLDKAKELYQALLKHDPSIVHIQKTFHDVHFDFDDEA